MKKLKNLTHVVLAFYLSFFSMFLVGCGVAVLGSAFVAYTVISSDDEEAGEASDDSSDEDEEEVITYTYNDISDTSLWESFDVEAEADLTISVFDGRYVYFTSYEKVLRYDT